MTTFTHRPRLSGMLATVAIAVLVTTSVAAPGTAATAATGRTTAPVASGCFVYQRGEINNTNAGFSQQLILFACSDNQIFHGVMHIHPNPGYTASHVVGCSMHIGLIDETTHVNRGDQTTSCLTQARSGKIWELDNVGWSIAGHSADAYQMSGWVNIQTHVREYDTTVNASVIEF
jgi:hypothetical protein